MGLFSRRRASANEGGLIAACGLSDWWNTAFTDSGRAGLEQLFNAPSQDGGTRSARLADGPLEPGEDPFRLVGKDPYRLVGTLVALVRGALAPREVISALLAKHEELARSRGNVLDLHFVYSAAIETWYARRESEPDALQLAIEACEKQIAIAPQAWGQFVADAEASARRSSELWGETREATFLAPSHRGFQQLAIIREKQGDFDEALRLSREAQRQGWRDGKRDWSARIARLEKRAARLR